MEDRKREILNRVASGELSPEEGAYLLQELEAGEAGGGPASEPEEEAGPGVGRAATATAALTRLRVIASMGSVIVFADPSVREAVARGPHTARREGDTMVIESNPELDGFRFGPFAINRERLVVHVHPDVALDADVSAGQLRVHGIRGPIHAIVQAGSLRIHDFTEPLDIDVQAGSVQAVGRLDHGHSRIRCHAGSVRVSLGLDSSVRVRARSALGRVSLPGGRMSTGVGGSPLEAVVGSGVGSLDVESEMGSVSVTA